MQSNTTRPTNIYTAELKLCNDIHSIINEYGPSYNNTFFRLYCLLQNYGQATMNSTFQKMQPVTLMYFIKFVLYYFESGDNKLFNSFKFGRRRRSKSDRIIKTIFESTLLAIDFYKTVEHLMAFLYLTYLAPTESFNGILSPTRTGNSPNDPRKEEYISNYILKTTYTKNTGDAFKKSVRKILKNSSQECFYKSSQYCFYKFCYNNYRQLGIFTSIAIIDSVQNLNDVISTSNKFNDATVEDIIRTFLYKDLNVYQILMCLNSEYLLNRSVGYDQDWVYRAISEWIKKYPESVDYINSNFKFCTRAFLMLICLWQGSSSKLQLRDNIGAITKLFNKENVIIMTNQPSCCYSGPHPEVHSFHVCMKLFSSLKMIDDDYLLEYLYNGNYKKTFTNCSGYGRMYLFNYNKDSNKDSKTSPIWYNITCKRNESKPYLINQKKYTTSAKIHGVSNKSIIRPMICLGRFVSVLGINNKHLVCIEKMKQTPKWTRLKQKKEQQTFRILDLVHRTRQNNRPQINQLFSLKLI